MKAGQGGAVDMCEGIDGATGPRNPDPSAGPTGLEVTRTTGSYAVSARDPKSLRRQLASKGPITEQGRRVDAYTAWRIRKSYNPVAADDGTCTTGPVTVRVGIDFSFPEWADQASADPKHQQRWDRYLTALDAHERGHECVGLQAAAELKRELEALEARPNCDALRADVKAETRRIIDRWLAIERDYDRVTDNGLREGASFP